MVPGGEKMRETTLELRTTLSKIRSALLREKVVQAPNWLSDLDISLMLRDETNKRVTLIFEGLHDGRFGHGLEPAHFEERYVRTEGSSDWIHVGYHVPEPIPTLPR